VSIINGDSRLPLRRHRLLLLSQLDSVNVLGSAVHCPSLRFEEDCVTQLPQYFFKKYCKISSLHLMLFSVKETSCTIASAF
jgi:hypothetical protein